MTTATVPTTLAQLTGAWTLDPSHSRIGFVARHAMVTKVRGAFNDFAGTAVVGDAGLQDTRIDLTLQVASVDTRNADRDGHLQSGDFFDAAAHPTITFTSTSVRVDGETLEVTGDLTIKGVTQSVTVPFEFEGGALDPFGNVRAGFEGKVVVNRKDFGLTWNAALETGGVLVGEKVTLEFEISAIKNA